MSYDIWLHFIILISAGIKTLSHDLDEKNCLRAQIIRKGLVIYMHMKIQITNIMECVKMLASFVATSSLNMQAIRRSIQHLVDRFSKLKKHVSKQWETIVLLLNEAFPLPE